MMIETLQGPWPWWIAGPLVGLIVPAMYLYGGRKWGISSTFRDACAATLPRGIEYFQYDWRREGGWRLAMAGGIVLGGLIAVTLLGAGETEVAIAASTRADLEALGIRDFAGLAPSQLFHWGGLLTPAGFIMIVGGGFLVGFGTRYAGGCTSGHAISGLSALRPASLIAVLGFFIGGLISTHLLLPLILGGGS